MTPPGPIAKRVCMIAYTLYTGDARVRREAETLAATQAYDVRVLTLKEGDTARDDVIEGVRVQQVNVAKYRGRNPVKYILSYVLFTWHALLAVTRLAGRGAIDIVHVHNMPNFLIFAAFVPMIQGKKVILDIHDTMPETFAATFSPAHRRFWVPILALEERFCAALADRLIAVNHPQREVILKRQPAARSKTIVSMNVPDPRLFTCDRAIERSPQDSDRFKLVYHGTVSGRLNVGLAVEAVCRSIDVIPEIQLHVIGDGDAKEQLVRSCAQRGFGDCIVFHDRVPFDRLIPFIRGMDLGVVSLESNVATDLMLPVKLMECLSVGVPVVAPKLKTIEYYFDPNMLFFFEPGDLLSLMAAILQARDRQERLTRVRNARAFLDRYNWNAHKATLLDLYEST